MVFGGMQSRSEAAPPTNCRSRGTLAPRAAGSRGGRAPVRPGYQKAKGVWEGVTADDPTTFLMKPNFSDGRPATKPLSSIDKVASCERRCDLVQRRIHQA